MQALRTRAACAARRTRPTAMRTATISRSYASDGHDKSGHDKPEHGKSEHGKSEHDDHHDHHDDHHDHGVEEGMGTGFYVAAASVPVCYALYSMTQPGADGEPRSVTKWLKSFDYFNDWEARNTLKANMYDQAAHDKHLFMYAGKNPHVELKMPELLNSGSPWNVPAGHYVNLDHVTEHYRKKAADEEERKYQKLLAKSKEAEQQQQQQS